MCGIFGYVCEKSNCENAASNIIIDGLKRMEYRGYDSWGVAVAKDDKIDVVKHVGLIGEAKDLETLPATCIGIGHTRWATHGGVTELNAHPHYSTDRSFVLAQNGIVENYQDLKEMLISHGYKFETQTDTEVIVRLVEFKLRGMNKEHDYDSQELHAAVQQAFVDLTGRNTIILLSKSANQIIAVRNGSPLVVGVSEGEYFFASDTLSFAHRTDKVVFVENLQMAQYCDGKLKLFNVQTDEEIAYQTSELDHDDVKIEKEGYEHFMLKEIVEQQFTIKEATQYTEHELSPLVRMIKSARTVYLVGAGTASFAAGEIAYFLRRYANIFAVELKSYEMGSYKELFTADDLLIAVSQSGETADTVEAVEFAKAKGCQIASIVNMVGSTLTRISDYRYFSRSGPEICVASTKAFTAQISWGILLAKTIVGEYEKAKTDIHTLSANLKHYFTDELFNQIKSLVSDIKDKEHFFVLGKGQNLYTSLEGALKVKEITYKHFEGFAAGELKHGVIALIEKDTPVFVIVSDDESKNDVMNAADQVKARGAKVIGVASENNQIFDFHLQTIPSDLASPIANVIPFQLVSYFMGVELGNNPDKPRNLAKSVTVK